MRKRQINVRISEPAYAVLNALASQHKPKECPCCGNEWQATDKYSGMPISTLAAQILEDSIRGTLKL
tara:strand:- start:1750 stop:1950 length:201 start_codon:yes stop_codon:yes gene_type:complete